MKTLILALVAVASLSVLGGCAGNPPVGAGMFADVPAGTIAFSVLDPRKCLDPVPNVVCVEAIAPPSMVSPTGRLHDNYMERLNNYKAAEKKQLEEIGAVATITEHNLVYDNGSSNVGKILLDIAVIAAPMVPNAVKTGFAIGNKGFSTTRVDYKTTPEVFYELTFPDGKKSSSRCDKGTPSETCRALLMDALKARGNQQQQVSSAR